MAGNRSPAFLLILRDPHVSVVIYIVQDDSDELTTYCEVRGCKHKHCTNYHHKHHWVSEHAEDVETFMWDEVVVAGDRCQLDRIGYAGCQRLHYGTGDFRINHCIIFTVSHRDQYLKTGWKETTLSR